jgi:hypothetical protein
MSIKTPLISEEVKIIQDLEIARSNAEMIIDAVI